MLVRACAGLRHAEGVARLRQTGSRASGIVMQWTLPPPRGAEIELRIQDLDPLGAQRRVDSGAVARRDDRSPPSASRLHDIAITSR